MSNYSDPETKPIKKKRGRPKKVKEPAAAPAPAPAPEPAPAPAAAVKKSKSKRGGPMSDAARADLNSHMKKMKAGGMSAMELKSHRMRVLVRMRRDGVSAAAAHKDAMGK